MRIISPKVQSLLPEHVGCFKWLQCSNRHRFLIMVQSLANNKSWDFYCCPKCRKPNYYLRPYRIFVICA